MRCGLYCSWYRLSFLSSWLWLKDFFAQKTKDFYLWIIWKIYGLPSKPMQEENQVNYRKTQFTKLYCLTVYLLEAWFGWLTELRLHQNCRSQNWNCPSMTLKVSQKLIISKFKYMYVWLLVPFKKILINFRLIGPPSDFALSLLFQNSKKDSIYGKLYKNNMEGPKSFYKDRNALE